MPLLEREITWGDASEETVSIGDDFFFTLAGVKEKLGGLDFNLVNELCSDPGHVWNFWYAENMTLWEKMLSYMQSRGVRLIRLSFPYTNLDTIAEELAAYEALLDLTLEYKMLVIAHITCKFWAGWNCSDTPNFLVPDGKNLNGDGVDTFDKWMNRLLPIIATYNNIVAVNCDNELDLHAGAQNYTAADVTTYLAYFTGLVKSLTPHLTTHNLADHTGHADIQAAVLPLIDIPSFDTYETPANIITEVTALLASLGVTSNWWCSEVGVAWDQNLVTPQHYDAAFKAGATTALGCASLSYADDTWSYFDTSGNPKSNLIRIMSYLQSLQKIGNLIT